MSHVLAATAPSGTNADSIATETVFWILAVISVGAALAMILVRQAVHCAIMLAVVMLCLATMYAMQGAPFLAFVQIIVYTGEERRALHRIHGGQAEHHHGEHDGA